MNAWKTEYKTNNNADTAHMKTMTAPSIKHGRVGIGTASPSEKLEVSGKVKATEFIGNGAVSVGTIVMWSGKIAPDGWALCDGRTVNNIKTPDLQGRFIAGVDSTNTN
ncbi:phage tail protein [Salibacteraceae bacterium]|nr:phage tail protein [Salibacteraceae bacterium]